MTIRYLFHIANEHGVEGPTVPPEDDFDELPDALEGPAERFAGAVEDWPWPDGSDGRMLGPNSIENLPPVEYLVDGLIPKYGVGTILGASATLKSFLALHLALCIASGRPAFPGVPCSMADVFYIAAEDGNDVRARYLAWCNHHGMRPVRFAIQPFPSYLNHMEETKDLIEYVSKYSPPWRDKLIVIDTLSANFSGDENGRDAADFIRNLQKLARDTGKATVLFVRHTGKDESKGERGSYAIRGNVNFSIMQSFTGGTPRVAGTTEGW